MSNKDKRLTEKQIQELMANPQKLTIQIEKIENKPSQRNLTFRGSDKNFDSLNVEDLLRLFGSFLKSVISRYDENKRLQEEAEAREMDLRHCMELVDGLTEKEKRMIYRRLTEALQTRRACKAENEILAPLYNEIADKALINKLARIQGQVSGLKDTVNNRTYGCRTSVLDDFRVETTERVYAVV